MTKMLFNLDETVKEHLAVLDSFEENVVAEFCKIAVNYLSKGGRVGEKSLQSAAKKLGLELMQIKNAVEALSHVLILCAGSGLDSADVVDSLLTAGLNQSSAETVETFFADNRNFLRAAVEKTAEESAPTGTIAHYKDLEWRIQVEIGSRALRNQFIPKVLCKLKTTRRRRETDSSPYSDFDDEDAEDGIASRNAGTEVVESHLLEIPPRDLVDITKTLEEALRVARSSRSRRIMRSVTC